MLAPWGWFSKDEKPVGAYNKLQESLSETVTQGMNLTTQAYKSTSDAICRNERACADVCASICVRVI